MAVDSNNATTGAPEFSDAGAPDLAVDPTAVGAYAADVGNRIVRADKAALEAYPYKRAGLSGYALDTNTEYVHNGTGWTPSADGVVIPLSGFSTGWTQTPGYTTYLIARGKQRRLVGVITRGAGGATTSMLTIPVEHRPEAGTFLGAHVQSGGGSYALLLPTTGIVGIPTGYSTGVGGSTLGAFPIGGVWEVA